MILPAAWTQQFESVLPSAAPVRAGAQLTAAAQIVAFVADGPANQAAVANQKTTDAPAESAQSASVHSDLEQSAFNQLISQLVAEDAVPVAASAPGSVPAATQIPKLTARTLTPIAALAPDLPALSSTLPAAIVGDKLVAAPPTGTRRIVPVEALAPKAGKIQFAGIPIDVYVPIAIVPKPQPLPLIASGSAAEKSTEMAPVSSSDESAPVRLEEAPVLKITIHLSPSEASAVATSAPAQATATPVAITARIPTPAGPAADPLQAAPQAAMMHTSIPRKAPPASLQMPVTVKPVVNTDSVMSPPDRARSDAFALKSQLKTAPFASPVAARKPIFPNEPTQQNQSQPDSQQNPEGAVPDAAPDTVPDRHAFAGTGAHTVTRDAGSQIIAPLPQPAAAVAPGNSQSSPASISGPVPVVPTTTAPAPSPETPVIVKPEPQPSGVPWRQESLVDPAKTQQPLRSLSLEFTPDGARDIKVRLSEHGGDVHISLHGTDPSLAGRVSEGVSDLVGSLSKAGYDAQAWTPGQGHQDQRQQSEQRKAPRNNSGGASAEEFSGIFEPAIQEII